jgi:hypothetical protein
MCEPRGRVHAWNRSISTEIYLCHACSDQEIEDGNGPDRERGGWYGVLGRDNRRVKNADYGNRSDTKSWFQDYHSMGAVYECIRSL